MKQQNSPYRTPEVPKDFGSFHWATVIGGVATLVLWNVAATEYIAKAFDFASALGEPLLRIKGWALYQPFCWFLWSVRYNKTHIEFVRHTLIVAACIVVAGCALTLVAIMIANVRRTKLALKGNEDLKGSARWANKEDLVKSGVLATRQGVYIGSFREGNRLTYLMHDGKEHVLAFAPTRSGKGVGIVIPTLLAWPDSTLVYDIKGENWAKTAGFRSSRLKQRCLKFSPLETSGSRFNPFDAIRLTELREIADVQNVAQMLIDTGDSDSENRYFTDEAISLTVGVILHLMYDRRMKGLPHPCPADLLAFLTSPEAKFQEILERISRAEHRRADEEPFDGELASAPRTHPTVASKVRGMLNKSEKEFSSVLSSAIRPLAVYADPLVRQATSASDFTIDSLVNGEVAASLYLVIPPSDKERLRPLVRLILTMFVNRLTEKMDFEDGAQRNNKHRLLFLIDEFPSLKKMTVFADALSYMAGYGLKALLITQDIRQIEESYGRNESIVSNCHVRIAYAPNNFQTAELLSRMTGMQTIRKANVNFSGNRASPMMANVSTSLDYIERPLLTPDEVSRLQAAQKTGSGSDEKITGPGQMLIFIAGQRPILGTQILYFADPELSKRSIIAPPAFPLREKQPRIIPPITPAPATTRIVHSDPRVPLLQNENAALVHASSSGTDAAAPGTPLLPAPATSLTAALADSIEEDACETA